MILKKFFKFLQERNFSLKYRPAYYRKVIHLFVLCLITSCCQHKICSLEKSWPAPYSLRHAGLLRWASVCAKSVVFKVFQMKISKRTKKIFKMNVYYYLSNWDKTKWITRKFHHKLEGQIRELSNLYKTRSLCNMYLLYINVLFFRYCFVKLPFFDSVDFELV